MSKQELLQAIEPLRLRSDEQLLKTVLLLLKNYLQQKNTIIGHTTDGLALTREGLLQMVETSYQQALAGDIITAEALLAEIDNWNATHK